MKILVCLKQILDPEISPRDFQLDAERKVAMRGNANLVTNIFCENALETALQIRDQCNGEITVLNFGDEEAEECLRKALALKADHAIRIDSRGVDCHNSAGAAAVLSAGVNKLGDFDLIMLGRESGDWGEGSTPGLMAEYLELPFISFVDQIELPQNQPEDSNFLLHRQTDFGREKISAKLPCVVSITNNEANVPRIPKTRDIMMAHRKELQTWSLADLGLAADVVQLRSAATEIVDLYIPERKTECEFVSGDSDAEKIAAFAQKLTAVLRSV